MSVFGDLASAASGAHGYYFAETITLTEPGAAAQNVSAVPGKVRTESRTDDHGRQQRVSVRDCRFVTLTTVRHDAIVTIDGVNWSIDEVLRRTASGLYVKLTRVQTHSVQRQNYRGKA